MKKRREFDPNPETPLDHWDDTIDPAIMSGDHWVEEEEAPLAEEELSKIVLQTRTKNRNVYDERFMHPTHNVGEKPWNEEENPNQEPN
ncbi:MAG: DUF3905 domain-containing protein [Bacillus sp. (in: Bacteria)]|nr:DUF3905 domain-containing protein [Bacillus sp. (in: firmicutes)]